MRRFPVILAVVGLLAGGLPPASLADDLAPPAGPMPGSVWLDPTWEPGDEPLVPRDQLIPASATAALRADIARYERDVAGTPAARASSGPGVEESAGGSPEPIAMASAPADPGGSLPPRPWPTASPSPSPTASPSPSPTASPSPSPTASPSPSPTASPSPSPTASPSPSPTASPSPSPTPAPTPIAHPGFAIERFQIRALAVGGRPYDNEMVPSLVYQGEIHDAAGVPMARINRRLVYKPAGLAQLALMYVNGYRVTGYAGYVDRAAAIVAVFRRIGRYSSGGLYLPYAFDFAMHGDPSNVVRGPWYSAMAQGLALSLVTRLWLATGDDGYRVTATQLMASVRHIGRGSAPWTTYIDRARNLWLEEYAQAQPEHTLNGFNFAVFGLYDWYLATRDPVVLQYLRGALTTLKRNVARYRNPGHPSGYCLAHRKQAIKYHRIHVWQLRFMAAITGDVYFLRIANQFERDAR